MSSPTDGFCTCPYCRERVAVSRFDLTVADADGGERAFFGIPAGVCGTCAWLVLDSDAQQLFRFGPGDVVSAIQSASCLLESRGRDAA